MKAHFQFDLFAQDGKHNLIKSAIAAAAIGWHVIWFHRQSIHPINKPMAKMQFWLVEIKAPFDGID